MKGEATAEARANIAFAKYWGKFDVRLNLPAVPSISLTLDPLVTRTKVRFDPRLTSDELVLNGTKASEAQLRRTAELLDRIRRLADAKTFARVESENAFPTAAGLASSASGFAALAAAATAALGLDTNLAQLSALARRSSASAARSVFGGYVELPAGQPDTKSPDELCAIPLRQPSEWDLRMIIAVVAVGPKAIGSTAGMELTRQTSPYYDAWLSRAPSLADVIRSAIGDKQFEQLGPAVEQSAFAMHACAMAAAPSVLYWQPATLAALQTIRRLREQGGISVWATMDAGPHVKALCRPNDAEIAERELSRTEGVLRVIHARPGTGVELV